MGAELHYQSQLLDRSGAVCGGKTSGTFFLIIKVKGVFLSHKVMAYCKVGMRNLSDHQMLLGMNRPSLYEMGIPL